MGSIYQRQQALQSPESSATLIHAIVRTQYGEEAYEWDPTTVYLELQADFQADTCSEALDRWASIQVLMTTDAFFKRVDAFLGICNTLNSGQPFFDVFDPVTVEEAAWGIVEVSLNRELLPFSYPVKRYLHKILRADGYDEDEYPDVFKEVFEARPAASDVRSLLAEANKSNIDSYIDEQLRDMVVEFNRIDDLKDLDNIIIERGIDEALPAASTQEA